jgi:FlaA1/EpsC-like NDP-sugar epimerase
VRCAAVWSDLLAQENAAKKPVAGKTMLLTGAGGFIGSALAEAIVRLEPGHLILLDHSERNLNEIDLKLAATTSRDLYTSVLGDICDTKLLSELLQRYRPHSVYHAAAFKHVPLMETNPFAAVANNALATYKLAQLVRGSGLANMVMISTDKAVNPISIMGASKRAAELALLNLNSSRTRMSAVRLGNVWGSQGSYLSNPPDTQSVGDWMFFPIRLQVSESVCLSFVRTLCGRTHGHHCSEDLH